MATRPVERLPQDPLVFGEDIGIPFAQVLQQTRRALDIREEESNGPARELGHDQTIVRRCCDLEQTESVYMGRCDVQRLRR
jgi:hypothetical protein